MSNFPVEWDQNFPPTTEGVLKHPKAWAIKGRNRPFCLLNALPAAFMPLQGQSLLIKGVSLDEMKAAVAAASYMGGLVSHVGHDSTADMFSRLLGVEVATNRAPAPTPGEGEAPIYLIGSFTPPRRLAEGELWAEGEILAMPIRWLLIW
jgi:Domain of unknown function (DUF1874)